VTAAVRWGRPSERGRRGAAAVVLAAVLTALLMALGLALASPAAAAGESISGTLSAGNQPVAGAVLTATPTAGGAPTMGTSGPDGRFTVTVAGGGTYAVRLDPATLPKGVTLAAGSRNPFTVTVVAGQSRAALFRLDKAGFTAATSKINQPLQLLVDGIKFGFIIAMSGLGLSLIFGTTGLTNFAHGELVTFGAISAWYFNVRAGFPFVVSALLAVVVGGLAGGVLELGLWRPLRRRGTGLIAALVVSIGLSLFLRYLFLFVYGGNTQPFREYSIQAPYDLGLITITPRDLASDVISLLVLVGVGLALQKSRLGTAIRAVADNRDLAAASGIAVQRVVLVVWAVGAGLAALGGILLGLTQQVRFDMGFTLLLLIFAGVTLGGLGTAYGALLGGLLVGILIQVSTLVIPSELKNVGALAVLVLVLLVKPTGLLGRRERIG